MPNYTQPDYRIPVAAGVTVQVESGARNPLGLTAVTPAPAYAQPNTARPLPPVSGQLSTRPSCLGASSITSANGITTST